MKTLPLPSSVVLPQRVRGREMRRYRQRGIMLVITLIALVALTLGGIAFMRSVDTSSLIAGNLAFSRASVALSDAGMEAARTQLVALAAGSCGVSPCLETNQPIDAATGVQQINYWANWQVPGFDYRSDAAWANALELAAPQPGFRVRYIVHRMCANAGAVTGNTCVLDPAPVVIGGGLFTGSVDYGSYVAQTGAGATNPVPYYRVTLRVDGPRNSLTYVQVWMV